jgi:hypothetical protein
MSLIKANAVQIGQSGTATQNFTLAVPSSPDGTIKLARGNAGSTTQDVLSVDASGNVSFVGNTTSNVSNSTAIATGSTTARSLANRFADVVNVKDFGAVGNWDATTGTGTNDGPAIQAAINSLGIAGGTVLIPNGMKCLIDTSIIINSNITLKGPFNSVGCRDNNGTGGLLYNQVSSLIINPLATINVKGGSGIDGCLIYRKGMVFPITNGETDFSGKAITGVQGLSDDMFVFNSMILGFEYAIYIITAQRVKIKDVNIDCKNGVYLENSFDVPRFTSVHCWPFTSVQTGDLLKFHRSGSAFLVKDSDWPSLQDCFSYGYFRGIHLVNTDDGQIVNCSVDGTTQLTGSLGIVVDGTSLRNRFANCQVSSQDSAAYINTPDTTYYITSFVNCRFSTSTNRGAWCESGSVTFNSCIFENYGTSGIVIDNTNNSFIISNNTFTGSVSPITVVNPNTNIQLNDNNYSKFANSVVGQNMGISPSTISSSVLTIDPEASVVNVPAGNFNKIQYVWQGREITLYFSTAGNVVTTTTGAHAIAKLAAAFTSQVGSTLTLISQGSAWYEKSRSI